jgi:hypothetical protein
MLSRSDSVFLKIGGLGFLLGFASWITWAVLAVLSFEGILLYNGDFRWMSGAFFQALYSRLIFYGLLALSSLLSAVGCFALSKKQASGLGLISGMGFAVTFVITILYLVPFIGIQSVYPNPYPAYLTYATYLLPLSIFLSLILWGAWLLINERKINVLGLSRTAGILFLASGAFGILIWPAILYWGFEIWLLLSGWLYAAGALMTTLIFFKVSRTPNTHTS